jgi:hypothetical protein
MPGKTVVFCEGIREAMLISIILDEKGINNAIISHETLENSQEGAPENAKINEFLRSRNRSMKYLLKDEGGDTKCVNSFLELYVDKDDRYAGIVFIDSTARDYFRRTAQGKLKRDILKPESENLYLTKDTMNSVIHRIFFTPDDLERQVISIIGKNLDRQNREENKPILKEFISTCRERRIAWFMELERVVLSEA